MSQPTIPNISPIINITPGQTVNLLLSSIALEEIALAHVINAEAEKIQFILGTLPGSKPAEPPSFANLIAIDDSVRRTLQEVILKEVLLQVKFDNVLHLIDRYVPR